MGHEHITVKMCEVFLPNTMIAFSTYSVQIRMQDLGVQPILAQSFNRGLHSNMDAYWIYFTD